jgi:Xaa-Pro aminopeptidase
MGASHNRGVSDDPWREGEVVCLDSGGNLGGYIGDLARMAVLGPPDAELEDLLGYVEQVQQAARSQIRAGSIGGEIFAAAAAVVRRAKHRDLTSFVAHGMGLISHEAPRLTSTGPVPYPADDGPLPLQPGMVLSVETTLLHPRRGFIKLEDTVIVTDDGYRAVGDRARGWNVASC